MHGYLLVAVGAAVGAPLRYLADRTVQSRHDSDFPWGTFVVNVAGCLILGLLTGAVLAATDSDLTLLLATGLCGTLTTYSTLSFETVRLLEQGARFLAMANLVATIVVGLVAIFAGYAVGTTFVAG